jgi:uncharacterized protein with NAD-binding domain and iron-sulfur cluster
VSDKVQKVAIIGGGVGAITAAYAITMLPHWQSRFDITLYQLGWRLGGKGASGRNLANGGRIEEHGLHIWAGFYDNAFRLLRDCYKQMNATGLRSPDAPLGTLEKAFTGLNTFFIAEEVRKDGVPALHPWRLDFQPNGDLPGTGGVMPTPFAFFKMLVGALSSLLGGTEKHPLPPRFRTAFQQRNIPTSAATPIQHLNSLAQALDQSEVARSSSAGREALRDLVRHAQQCYRAQETRSDAVRAAAGAAVQDAESDTARRQRIMIGLGLAFCRGAVDSDLFSRGFDVLDDREISEWLLHHGAPPDAVDSALFRGCYDYVFGYPGGVTDDRSVGAGTALRGLLRLAFTYKGSLFFKMMAGMGDTIFGPYLSHPGRW